MKANNLSEKIGYGFGDMASSMFWKVFSYYLPFFYSNIFGLSLTDAGVILLVTRIWDAVSDPMMGVIADRTKTRWGKYRPYLLWMAPFFSVCGILVFAAPDFNYAGKLVWAYTTYLLMMTVYTAINVPYGAMLGVMTDDSREKTVFSSFRMFFAYGGSFVAMFFWEPLTKIFGGYQSPEGWFWAMFVIASCCLALFLLCFSLTREHIHTVSNVSVGSDFKALLHNRPWWILIVAALSFNLFCTVRGATVAYYFNDIIGDSAVLVFGAVMLPFYAGLFLSVGEVSNMLGVAATVPVAGRFGKKTSFILVNALLVVLSVAFYFVPSTPAGYWVMLIMQVVTSILTGIMSPLVWSMYADVSDYAEHRFHTASTGLIFSSSSMAQKFGSAIGGWATLTLLGSFGYITDASALSSGAVQPESALVCLRSLMSFVPALVSLIAIAIVHFYPLTTKRMAQIAEELRAERKG